MMTFSMTISMRTKEEIFDNSLRKKNPYDNDDFDDVEEKAVKTAPKQASAPKQTASAPSKVTVKQERAERQTRSCSIFQDYSNEKQPQNQIRAQIWKSV